jgi:hypothetical protein
MQNQINFHLYFIVRMRHSDSWYYAKFNTGSGSAESEYGSATLGFEEMCTILQLEPEHQWQVLHLLINNLSNFLCFKKV